MTATAAQIRTNHERAAKAAEAMNGSLNHDSTRRVTAECDRLDQPAVLVVSYRPYGSKPGDAYEVAVRYQTRIDQKIGKPVTYRNQYTQTNMGTMCWGLEEAEKARRRKQANLRKLEQRLLDAQAEVVRLQQLIVEETAKMAV